MNITGGGTGVIPRMLKSGGFSKNFLGANIPYSMKASQRLVLRGFKKFTTERVSLGLAKSAWDSARFDDCSEISAKDPYANFGVGVTAKLFTKGQRAGRENFAHISVYNELRYVHRRIRFTTLDREAQEEMLENAIIKAMVDFVQLKETKLFVYAGTFNPFHDGHKEIHDETLNIAKSEDATYELAISMNPYGKAARKKDLIDKEVTRISEDIFGDEHDILIRPDWTPLFIDKVGYYFDARECDKVVFSIGFDMFEKLFLDNGDFLEAARKNNWIDKVQFLVFEREDQNMTHMCMSLDTTKMIHPATFTSAAKIKNQFISSTKIRKENE